MKILEVFGEPILNGGQEAFVVSFVNEMNNVNFHFDLMTPYEVNSKAYQTIIDNKGGHIYSLGFSFEKDKGKLQIFKCLADFLKTNHYDVVHINSGSTYFLAMACYVAKRSRVAKVIVHSHCAGNKESLKHRIVKKISAPVFEHYADEICACSLAAAQWKFSEHLIRNKLIIVKNGIDTDKFCYDSVMRDRLRKKLHISESTYVLGHVGRFAYEKNQNFLIRLFEEYVEVESDSLLLLIGDGEDRAKQMEYVDSHAGIKDKVIFIGNVSNVHEYLQAMDVFVFPSLYEGLGISALEAECTGLPVLASDAITRDIAITDHIFFLPLSENKMEWIAYLNKFRNTKGVRMASNQEVFDAGYSVQNTVETMEMIFRK